MAAQRDYILRMIEQIALLLARIRQRILAGDAATARDELHAEAARQGVDLALARALDPHSLLLLLSPTGEPEPARCWLIAELLVLDGEQCEAAGEVEQAVRSYENALRLFYALDPAVIGGLPEARGRIPELEQRITRLNHG